MITNCKNTTISEELNIMNMFDEDFKMWDEQMSDIERELEQYRLSMEARGYVANPYFDENHADWKEHYYARNGLVMDKFNDFDCFDFVTPEDLKWYEHKREVLALGHTLYERLLTDEEKEEDYRCYCEECRRAA
jgi:hypothetical protein